VLAFLSFSAGGVCCGQPGKNIVEPYLLKTQQKGRVLSFEKCCFLFAQGTLFEEKEIILTSVGAGVR